MRVLTSFDLRSNLGLTKGILDILVEKALRVLWCSNGLRHIVLDVLAAPWRRNEIFEFFGVGTQIEGGQNTVSTAAPSLSNISSAMRGFG